MSFVNYNSMNMLGMNNMFSSNMFGSGNISQLFSGTGSIFDCSGMFGSNIFGGGCSLFTNCKGQPNYGAIAGFGVANVLLNIGGSAVSQLVQEKKTNSPKMIEQDVNGIQKEIDTELKKLGSSVNESNYKTYDVKTESWYTDGVKEIEDKKSEIKGKLSENDLNNQKTISQNCETKIKELREAKTKEGADVSALDTQIKAQESIKKDADDAIKAHEKAVKEEKALDEKLKALNEKAERKQKDANAIIEKITDLIDKRDNAQAQLNDAKLDRADGTRLNRVSESDFNKLFDSAGNCTKKQGDVKKSEVRFAILRYRNAKTQEEKMKCANQFKALFENLSEEDKKDKNLSAAYGLICK